MKINPRTITYVRAIAEERSFSRAAEKLYISQPSLSQHILKAEREYGVQFFDRRSMPVSLTYAGERFLAIADKMELLDRELNREMADISGNLTGRITVGVSPTRGAAFIPRLFSRFKQEYPGIELALVEDHNDKLLDAAGSGKVDFAFTGYGKDGLEDILIARRKVLLAAQRGTTPEAPSVSDEVYLAELADRPFVLLKKGRGIRRIADRLFERESVRPVVAYETSSYDMALEMAAQGLGMTFAIEQPGQRLPAKLRTRPIADSKETYQLHMVYRADTRLTSPLVRFIELARALDADLQE